MPKAPRCRPVAAGSPNSDDLTSWCACGPAPRRGSGWWPPSRPSTPRNRAQAQRAGRVWRDGRNGDQRQVTVSRSSDCCAMRLQPTGRQTEAWRQPAGRRATKRPPDPRTPRPAVWATSPTVRQIRPTGCPAPSAMRADDRSPTGPEQFAAACADHLDKQLRAVNRGCASTSRGEPGGLARVAKGDTCPQGCAARCSGQ